MTVGDFFTKGLPQAPPEPAQTKSKAPAKKSPAQKPAAAQEGESQVLVLILDPKCHDRS